MRCPTCKREFPQKDGAFRPFCSHRCKLLDLGKWLDGSFAIPGEPATDEDLAADLTAAPPPDKSRSGPRR